MASALRWQPETGGETDPMLTILHRWRKRRRPTEATVHEVHSVPHENPQGIAHEAGPGTAERHAVAGKWPDSNDLLKRRMVALGLGPYVMAKARGCLSDDMNRACSGCELKARCAEDLDCSMQERAWSVYCPNANTLVELANPNCKSTHRGHQ